MKRFACVLAVVALLAIAQVVSAETVQLNVTSSMITSDATFYATESVNGFPGGVVNVSNPIPYGITNNTTDQGWIMSGNGFNVNFGAQTALQKFRAWSGYANEGRGADWLIRYSNDNSTWNTLTTFSYVTQANGGYDALAADGSFSGTARSDCAGWYGIDFNSNESIKAQYWRVEYLQATNWHSPRTAEVAYYGTQVPEPTAIVLMVTGLLGLLAYAWRKRK